MVEIVFFKVLRLCERAEWATKTSWESRKGFSSGGRGERIHGTDTFLTISAQAYEPEPGI